ncbi:hypothetical protein PVA45_05865 [Entomospira entomophila]|uniref:Uncharacterized protein n=1 Tax=Entomospira entomophila TaxID=2719988 RepID=A0A968KRS4_9SPIO|nr:hypothetical protein [Entomospira entomophilus]NIZ41024.1 hypothetical protein [Entomospira entomophilus]WDI35236.1 hypothetical protein PVA45_05865 [Entomospira entomophilus]
MTTLSRRHLGMLDFHAKEMTLICRGVTEFSYLCADPWIFVHEGVNVFELEITKAVAGYEIELSLSQMLKVTCNTIDITVKFKEESDLIITDD